MDLVLNSKYAKAIAVAALTLAGILIHWGITGELDQAELEAAIVGLLAVVVTYTVPNAETEPGIHENDPPEADTTTLGTNVHELPTTTGD